MSDASAPDGDITGEFRPPEVAEARNQTVRRPMSVGINTDRFLPSWVGSVRFRIALVYSILLFGLAAVVVGGLYAGISREIGGSLTEDASFDFVVRDPDTGEQVAVRALQDFEAEVDRRALEDLRQYSFAALGMLFVTSLGVGWYVAGIVLRPIQRITDVARSINARDLNRRINLGGPDDELGRLANTFDDMLDRLDMAFASQVRFIHEASHELRNPLAVIRTNLDVTLADPDASAEDLRRTGEVVGRSAERMSTLVDDLLDHARAETRAQRVEEVNLATVAESVAEEFVIPASVAAVTIETAVDVDDDLVVDGDPVALRRAIANLLANAIRLAPPETSIWVRAGSVENWVWVGVQDQGPGIAPGDQQRVFRRLWRGDQTSNFKRDGRSGLGLAIVKQIAETHDGTVRLESELGQGATFVIWLPRTGESASDIGSPDEVIEAIGSVAPVVGDGESEESRTLTGALHPPD